MMRRTMQANEIRTNIDFEFAVVGETGVKTVTKDVLEMVANYQEQGILVRLVGISLKKPTSNPVYLTKHIVDVQVDSTAHSDDEVTLAGEVLVEESNTTESERLDESTSAVDEEVEHD